MKKAPITSKPAPIRMYVPIRVFCHDAPTTFKTVPAVLKPLKTQSTQEFLTMKHFNSFSLLDELQVFRNQFNSRTTLYIRRFRFVCFFFPFCSQLFQIIQISSGRIGVSLCRLDFNVCILNVLVLYVLTRTAAVVGVYFLC